MIELLKALSDENRLRILNLLLASELCVCEIETILEMTQSNVSRHLTKLKTNKIIISSKDAQWVHYKVSSAFLEQYANFVQDLKVYFSKNHLFKNDMNRYFNYVKLGLSCSDIKKDVVHVQTLIRSEGI